MGHAKQFNDFGKCISLVFLILSFQSISYAKISDEEAIHCLLGEARNQGLAGMQAVGEVLRRRGSSDGFYGCKSEFNEPEKIWGVARLAWDLSEESNISNGAMYFESVDFKAPYWSNDKKIVAEIGKHRFWR